MGMSKIVAARQAKCAAAVLQLRLIDLGDRSLDGLRESDALLLAFQAVEIARDAINDYETEMTYALRSDIEEEGRPCRS